MAKIKRPAMGEVWKDHGGNDCYYRENGSLCVITVNDEPSLTIQSEKDSCDINKIIEKFTRTGIMTNIRQDQPMYGDFSDLCDYQTARIRVQEAEEQFMELPASIRTRFDNDPGKLIDFLGDENNRAEAIELGLVAPPQPPQMVQGDATPPSAGEGAPAPQGG